MRTAKPTPFCLTIISAFMLVYGLEAQADQHAQAQIETSETEAPPNPNEVGLSLREAVDLAIENNLGVEVARHAPLIASEDVDIAWGVYDPVLSGGMSYSNTRLPNTSPLNQNDASRNKDRNGNAKITSLVPLLGATVSMDYVGARAETNQGFSSLSPQWSSGLAFKASVPLLRGLVWNNPWTQVKVSNVLHESSLESFRADLMDTVLGTVQSYWQLVAQQEQLRVAKKSHQTSLALLDQTKIQYEVGVKSKVEVIQAEAGVAERELEVINTEARYQNSQDALIDAVYGVRLTPNSLLQIAPTDSPSDFDEIHIDREVAAQLAAENRPELASLKLEIERQEVLVRFRKNQRLPQLDLNVSYGTSGIEGKGNPEAFDPMNAGPPPGTAGNFSDTHDQWFEKRGGREYAVGGVISIPLGNYGPRHSVSRARLELRRAKTQMLALNQNIILEVRRDIRLFEAALKGIDASERQRIAAEEQLRAERIRLEHGESTPFDVLQKESDLVNAEVSKIRALQLYRTSAANLDRRQGTILRTHNIVVGSVGALRNGMESESFGLRDILDPINPASRN
ncbi:MAG: TolC family protein [Myxococcota bacterium]|nr:TolC family protein [Myxococcota bacterium]